MLLQPTLTTHTAACPASIKRKVAPNRTHPDPNPCTSGRASRTPGARPPPKHRRHTPENTTLLHRCTRCLCLCLQCTRAPFFPFEKKKGKKKTGKKTKIRGGGKRDTTTNGTRQPHTARTPVNRRHLGQDTAQAHAPRAAKGRDTAQGRHTGEQEPSGPGHHTNKTKDRAGTPVNRS